MKHVSRLIGIGTILGLASAVHAEKLHLRSGQVLVGEVRVGEAETIEIEARFPEVKTIALQRSDLTPESLFEVLERRADPQDSARRKELGELADGLNLKGLAVAEYRAVKTLDAAQASDMDARIARLLDGIAADLLEDAKDLLEQENPRAAIMYLHTILEQYPDTEAAADAQRLMAGAHEAAGDVVEASMRTVAAKEAPKLIESVQKHLEKGDRWRAAVGAHEGSSVAGQRAAERAIGHYEDAWEEAKDLPLASGDPDLQRRIDASRASARGALLEAYLTAGSVHLQRRSIPSAERYCNKACALDPENKENHALHWLIVRAKALDQGFPILRW